MEPNRAIKTKRSSRHLTSRLGLGKGRSLSRVGPVHRTSTSFQWHALPNPFRFHWFLDLQRQRTPAKTSKMTVGSQGVLIEIDSANCHHRCFPQVPPCGAVFQWFCRNVVDSSPNMRFQGVVAKKELTAWLRSPTFDAPLKPWTIFTQG